MATIRTAIQVQDGMTAPLRSMNNALNIVMNSFESMQRLSGNAVDSKSIRTARTELARAEIGFNQVEQSIQEANQRQQQLNNNIRNGSNDAGGLSSKIKGYVAAFAGIAGLKKGAEITDSYINQSSRLALINDGLQTQEQLQQKIFQAAQRSRGVYGDTVNTVAKLGLLAGDAFKGNGETIRFAELMTKSFKISGASASESANGMYQLTQAMASGRLQGDEFRSIMENAPMLAQAIAKYTGKSMGSLREMSSEGLITSDIIKNALFQAGDDIEGKFKTMPRTFADVWNSITNNATQKFSEIMQKINGFINSDTGQKVIDGISNAIGSLAQGLGTVFNIVSKIATFFVNNWSTIEPIIVGITTAMLAYRVATLICAAATWLSVAANRALAIAMLANPITWIALAIGIVIALIYKWVKSVGGIKVAWLMCMDAILKVWDLVKIAFFIGVFWILNLWDNMMCKIRSIVGAIQNFMGDMKAGVLTILQDMVNGAIDLINKFIGVVNKIPGVSIDTVKHVTFGTDAQIKNDAEKKARESDLQKYKNEIDAQAKVRDTQIRNMAKDALSNADKRQIQINAAKSEAEKKKEKEQSTIPNDVAKTANNTSAIKDSMDISQEDLKYMRDLAERDVVNRFTTANLKVEFTSNNNIKSDLDLDGIVSKLEEKVSNTLAIAAEGVHA